MSAINTYMIGVQKAGTTSLYELLSRHPEVNAPLAIKDDHFFVSPIDTSKVTRYYTHKSQAIQLHCGVNYIHFEDSMERLARYNPEAKVIISLRNPVNRFLSALRFNRQRGIERRQWTELIEDELAGYKTPYEKANFEYLAHGNYFKKLKKCFELFSRSSVHLLWFEEWTSDPDLINVLFDFLEIERKELKFNKLNVTGASRIPRLSRFIHGNGQVKKTLTPFWRGLPYSFRKSVIDRIDKFNFKQEEEEEVDQNLIDYLVKYYKAENEALEDLLGKDLSKLWN